MTLTELTEKLEKYLALSSSKIDKHECLTVEAILPSNQSRIIEQGKFTYSPLGKDLEKQIKTIKDQGRKQVEAISFKTNWIEKIRIKDSIPEDQLNEKAKNEIEKIF